MAFRANNQSAADAYEKAKRLAGALKRQTANRAAAMAGGGDANLVLATIDGLRGFRQQLLTLQGVGGIAAYARSVEDDPAYDVVAEFVAMVSAIDDAILGIAALVPRRGGANRWVELFTMPATGADAGTLVPRTFTGAQLSGVITLLQAIDATIT